MTNINDLRTKRNEAFPVYSRDDIDLLWAEIDRLTAERDSLRSKLNGIETWHKGYVAQTQYIPLNEGDRVCYKTLMNREVYYDFDSKGTISRVKYSANGAMREVTVVQDNGESTRYYHDELVLLYDQPAPAQPAPEPTATATPAKLTAAQAFQRSDGGRASAGYKGTAGDCVVRAIANATGKPYQEVYGAINELAKRERTGKRKKHKSSARDGVYKNTTRKYMKSIGWTWYSTMSIGSGCKVHLKADELPSGRLVVVLSKHMTAVIDGVIIDTYDPSRDGTRCVYGYYALRGSEAS